MEQQLDQHTCSPQCTRHSPARSVVYGPTRIAARASNRDVAHGGISEVALPFQERSASRLASPWNLQRQLPDVSQHPASLPSPLIMGLIPPSLYHERPEDVNDFC